MSLFIHNTKKCLSIGWLRFASEMREWQKRKTNKQAIQIAETKATTIFRYCVRFHLFLAATIAAQANNNNIMGTSVDFTKRNTSVIIRRRMHTFNVESAELTRWACMCAFALKLNIFVWFIFKIQKRVNCVCGALLLDRCKHSVLDPFRWM